MKSTPAQIHYLNDIVSRLQTKKYFMEQLPALIGKKSPLIFAVRVPSLVRKHGFPHAQYHPNERTALTTLINADNTLRLLNTTFDRFPAQFSVISREQLAETLQKPAYYVPDGSFANRMRDQQGKYLNIQNGFRVTMNQPERCCGNVYLFGSAKVYGYGSADSQTIASQLQQMIQLPLKVHNCSNYTGIGAMYMALRLMREMEFARNDIIVLFIDNAVAKPEFPIFWMNWDAIEEPVIKVDAFPLFQRGDRPDYFLLPQGYTEAGNRAIAELVCDAIHRNYPHIG